MYHKIGLEAFHQTTEPMNNLIKAQYFLYQTNVAFLLLYQNTLLCRHEKKSIKMK